MRLAIRQDESAFEVRAMDDWGRRIGRLDAQVTSWEQIMETANEAAADAADFEKLGKAEDARSFMQAARRYDLCARSVDRLQLDLHLEPGALGLYTVVSLEVAGDDLNTAAALYRAAAVVASKRESALVAPPCTEYLGRVDPNYATRVWKMPAFRRGMALSGPVAYYKAPAAARAANPRKLKRSLLRF